MRWDPGGLTGSVLQFCCSWMFTRAPGPTGEATGPAQCGAGRGRVLWSAQLLTPLVLSFSDWLPHCGVSVVPRRWAVASGSSCAAIILMTCLQGLAAHSREGPLPSPQPGPRSTCPVPKAWGGQDSSASLGRGCWGQNQSRSGLQPSP